MRINISDGIGDIVSKLLVPYLRTVLVIFWAAKMENSSWMLSRVCGTLLGTRAGSDALAALQELPVPTSLQR